MTKHFITVSLFLSLLFFSFSSCKDAPAQSKEAKRFEQMLKEAHFEKNDTRYLIWNSSSCGGCRVFSANLLRRNKQETENVRLIVPFSYAHEAAGIDSRKLFIDSAGVFDKLYFGVDNIGIVYMQQDKVTGIRNYNSNAMDTLRQDLLK